MLWELTSDTNRFWNAIMRIYTVVCGSPIFKISLQKHKPSIKKKNIKPIIPGRSLPLYIRPKKSKRKTTKRGRIMWEVALRTASRLCPSEQTWLHPNLTSLNSLQLKFIQRGLNLSYSPPITIPSIPPLSSACLLHHQRNTVSVTLCWLWLPNPLNVGKAWNDEELGLSLSFFSLFFFHTYRWCPLPLPCFPVASTISPETHNRDPLVVLGAEQQTQQQECRRICVHAGHNCRYSTSPLFVVRKPAIKNSER